MITNDTIRDAYAEAVNDGLFFETFVTSFPLASHDDVRRRTPRIIRDFERMSRMIVPKLEGMPEFKKTGSSKLWALAKPAPNKYDFSADIDSI